MPVKFKVSECIKRPENMLMLFVDAKVDFFKTMPCSIMLHLKDNIMYSALLSGGTSFPNGQWLLIAELNEGQNLNAEDVEGIELRSNP